MNNKNIIVTIRNDLETRANWMGMSPYTQNAQASSMVNVRLFGVLFQFHKELLSEVTNALERVANETQAMLDEMEK